MHTTGRLHSITNIGYEAFFSCTSLANITIPHSVTNIGSYAFAYCTSLTAITVDTNNPVYTNVAGVLFDQSQTTLIQCPGGKAGNYTVPNSATSIGGGAFWGCTSLTNITIPNSITNIGGLAFSSCTSLTNIKIPNSLATIASGALEDCTSLTSITIPKSVTSIGTDAFSGCAKLTGVYFNGNAPSGGSDSSVFRGDNNATVYYLPGTTGWGTTFGGLPTKLWNPQIQANSATFGVRTNRFGFTITGTSGLVIVVEACPNLTNPVWQPIRTNTLTGGSSYFSDPQWTNYPSRFYRLRSP